MSALPCIEAGPSSPCRGTVLWLHGLGADGHDFEPIVPQLGLPDVRFVFPHAPTMPVTINNGAVMRAWYDILTWDAVPGRENAQHIRASAEHIQALIDREIARGHPPERIVLAGFSQGAAMALHVGLRYPQTLAGILVLSGYLVLPDTVENESSPANAMTPTMCCHGTSDHVVSVDRGRLAFETVSRAGRPAEWYSFPMAHELCMDEVECIRDWLTEMLPR
ncbi:MAG: alpha/beta fold hydrolase [Myxococcota bacterium]|nr:alpha/beta fold hydrolase [Myxococcota bacterium]